MTLEDVYPPKGSVEVIAGGMFSGKTSELLRRVERVVLAHKPLRGKIPAGKHPVVVFKPTADTRSGDVVATHSKREWPAINIAWDRPRDLLQHLGAAKVVGIEEVQFFSPEIVEVVDELVNGGFRVIIAGLDTDSMGRPFGSMPIFLSTSEDVVKLTAICTVCGEDACRSQKIVLGGDLVDIGAAGKYEARCRRHFTPAQ